jgi:hypothetical protein
VTGEHGPGTRPGVPRTCTPEDVQWRPLYERASVERFLADTEAERVRLHGEIEMAKAQRDAARHVLAARQTAAQAELGALVFDAERTMAALEDAHREVVRTVRDAAETEAARVLAAAHHEVEVMREVTASLAARVARRHDRPHSIDLTDAVSTDETTTRDRADAS